MPVETAGCTRSTKEGAVSVTLARAVQWFRFSILITVDLLAPPPRRLHAGKGRSVRCSRFFFYSYIHRTTSQRNTGL